MKVIDLLNKIANGEEVPEKIKFHDLEFKFRNKGYYCELEDKFEPLGSIYILDLMLKDKVEIIEEDKKIEKVHECFISTDNKEIQFLIDNINQLGNKVNKIIDKINEDK